MIQNTEYLDLFLICSRVCPVNLCMATTKTHTALRHAYLVLPPKMGPPTPPPSHAFHHTIDDFLPGIRTCCPSLHCLQSTLTLPPLPVSCCHVWFCTYLIPFVRNSIGSASHVHTTIVHCTILTPTSLWRSCLEPMSPSAPTQPRVRQTIIHYRGPGLICPSGGS